MTSAGFVSRSCVRNLRRSVLTASTVAIAIFVAMLMISSIVHTDSFIESAAGSPRLVIQNGASMTLGLPLAYATRIAQIPGVKSVCAGYWTASFYREPRYALPAVAVSGETFADTFPDYEVTPVQLKRFAAIKNGAL